MTWDNAGDNDGQGVVCILQGAPVWFTVLVLLELNSQRPIVWYCLVIDAAQR
jgi:hypothetical protein